MRIFKFLRPSFIFPFTAICILIALYFTFFLELHLKYIIERSLFESLGSEVNIARLDIQPFKQSIGLKKIQFTDPDKPEQNIFELESIQVFYTTTKLLNLSFQSDLVNVLNIRFHTARKRPGRVLSKDKRVLVLKDPSTHKVTDEIKKKLDSNTALNLAKMVKGDLSSKEIEKISSQFSTKKLYEELDIKKTQLDSDFKTFKRNLNSEKMKTLQNKIKNFKFSSDSSEESLASTQKTLRLIEEVKSQKKNLKSQFKNLKSKLKDFKAQARSLPDRMIQDIDLVKKDYNKLDPNRLSEELFGEYFALQLSKIGRVKSSMQQSALNKVESKTSLDLNKHLKTSSPTKKEVDPLSRGELEKKRQALIRKKGRVFYFTDSPDPKYWLKKIQITSKSSENQDLGDCSGLIENLTSNPEFINKPLSFNIEGSAPKQDIGFFNINGVLDKTKPLNPKETIQAEFSKYKVKDFEVFSDKDAFLNFQESEAQTLLNFIQENEELTLSLDQILIPRISQFNSDNKTLEKILKELSEISPLKFSLSAKGELSKPQIKITSNIAKSFIDSIKNTSKGLANEKINAEISKLKQKVSGEYLARVDADSLALDQNSQSLEKQIDTFLDAEIKKLKTKLDNKKDEKLDKLKNKLLKKLKF